MRVDLPLDKKLWKIRTGPPGCWASGPWDRRGPWAAGRGPLGLRAAGPPGRRGLRAAGRWAAGLLLAKPPDIHYKPATDLSRVYRGILDYNHENNDFQGGTILNITNYENLFPIIYFDLAKQKWI